MREAQILCGSKLDRQIKEAFNNPTLNISSPKQLFGAFRAEGVELEDTSEKTLSSLSDPRANLILTWRGAAKLASNVESLLNAERDGRLYAQFNPLGTVTGRFSSKKPNLQSVTRGALRSCFVASAPDRSLIIGDYNQVELRVAALIAGETVMIEALKSREDLHKKIVAINLGISSADVTEEQRTTGKAINFGLLYGQGAKGFMNFAQTTYGIRLPFEKAELFRANFFRTYPALAQWHKDCWQKAKDPSLGEARTVFGRLLRAQKNAPWQRFNMWTAHVVSGSCADLLKMATVKIAVLLPGDCHLVATVHDELIYDVPAELAEHYRHIIKGGMEESFIEMFGTAVPVQVKAKVCSNWGEK